MEYATDHRCPFCDRPQEAVAQVGGDPHEPDSSGTSIGICRRCYGLFVFDFSRPTRTRAPSCRELPQMLEDLPPAILAMREHKIRLSGIDPNAATVPS